MMLNPDLQSYLLTSMSRAQSGHCCRILHGRGKTFGPDYEALNVDLYQGVVIVFSYDQANGEVIAALSGWFKSQQNLGIKTVVVQHRDQADTPWEVLWGEISAELYAQEHDLSYRVNLGNHQNIGFFPDMAIMRRWFLDHSQGKRILNLFAYTCSISVAAIRGGAEKVVNVDMSSPALHVGRENHRLNNLDTDRVVFQKLNMLKSWGRIARFGPYNCIFIDPPTLQKGSFALEQDYHKVVRRTAEMLTDDGVIFVCSNSPSHSVAYLQAMVKACTPRLSFETRVDCGEAFRDVDPDAGLKVLRYIKRQG